MSTDSEDTDDTGSEGDSESEFSATMTPRFDASNVDPYRSVICTEWNIWHIELYLCHIVYYTNQTWKEFKFHKFTKTRMTFFSKADYFSLFCNIVDY